ncbi:hypothetical protein EHI8A_056680 [Entamoeba histolytica HM-1:IMSS-B]|uniref:Uncharacterized protein n=5 Tax=Entamoeba histolytica TaxID=5759 RepID=C4M544_ENTH1|nr:hypothetical protein EHI_078180 [Entamoeba histolytica HM-1:IMSS]EMD47460.1 Hypothetical protein EHI5A_063960 [Entamoeba histolytica KU27]EMH72595.1 hypothetical protein EHI8A_056680 [Entamoeba histolytica HM-1:IMSS-B]ENY61800.1 hypothetical protein EHI7A_036250 [Entamoeba histolytica HM-1:IMSS-A]GAT96516.1 hypothetical protein CL6EHI_078180 [Entamoeba histolytica]EAL46606.1 hypothetical protein EHI_078180 [Entamoeba histolytica HM-1:IMSS]|eukprot:XP_651992.1 hypothetical protein EHI_078180 [Entamoeba histolytica HM-1:IMSS]
MFTPLSNESQKYYHFEVENDIADKIRKGNLQIKKENNVIKLILPNEEIVLTALNSHEKTIFKSQEGVVPPVYDKLSIIGFYIQQKQKSIPLTKTITSSFSRQTQQPQQHTQSDLDKQKEKQKREELLRKEKEKLTLTVINTHASQDKKKSQHSQESITNNQDVQHSQKEPKSPKEPKSSSRHSLKHTISPTSSKPTRHSIQLELSETVKKLKEIQSIFIEQLNKDPSSIDKKHIIQLKEKHLKEFNDLTKRYEDLRQQLSHLSY